MPEVLVMIGRVIRGLRRAWFALTGECGKYDPDENGLCRVCRIPGASDPS